MGFSEASTCQNAAGPQNGVFAWLTLKADVMRSRSSSASLARSMLGQAPAPVAAAKLMASAFACMFSVMVASCRGGRDNANRPPPSYAPHVSRRLRGPPLLFHGLRIHTVHTAAAVIPSEARDLSCGRADMLRRW